MTTHTEGRPPTDDEVDRRLRMAGARLHEHVAADVDVDTRLSELVSRRARRRRWLPIGVVAGATLAAIVAAMIVTSPSPVVIEPLPDFTGPPQDEQPDVGPPGESEPSEPLPDEVEPPEARPDETDPADVGDDCSAAQLDESEPSEGGLPDAVEIIRGAIVRAALACDFEGLAALTSDEFSYSFGGGTDPITHWRQQEEAGEEPLAVLVELLALPVGDGQEVPTGDGQEASPPIWSWPRAYTDPTTPAHLAELEQRFGAEAVADWFTPDGDYYGPRVGIRGDGTWLFYVAGD